MHKFFDLPHVDVMFEYMLTCNDEAHLIQCKMDKRDGISNKLNS